MYTMIGLLKRHCRLANQVEGKYKTHFRYFVESADNVSETWARNCLEKAYI